MNNSKVLNIILSVVALIGIGFGAWSFMSNSGTKSEIAKLKTELETANKKVGQETKLIEELTKNLEEANKANYTYVVTQPLDPNDVTQGILLVPATFNMKEYLDLYKPEPHDSKESLESKKRILEGVQFDNSGLPQDKIDTFNSEKAAVISSLDQAIGNTQG